MITTIRIGDRTVPRIGYGTMGLPGPGAYGPSPDPEAAITALRTAADLGVRLIDTSGYYGPDVANRLVAEALRPYPDDLLIATKVGARRGPDRSFLPHDTPEAVRSAVERDLEVLGVPALDLVHARRMPTSAVPFADTVGALDELRRKGLIRSIGVSNVDVELLQEAQSVARIATVENLYNLTDRASDPVLAACERDGIAFLPFRPLSLGDLRTVPAYLATELGATPAQVALAWLLRRSPAIAPIPGTTSLRHLAENVDAAHVHLTDEQFEALDEAA